MIDLVEGARRNSVAGEEFSNRYRALRKAIGANIASIRKERNMALKKLARKTGISTGKLDYWEMGRMDISLGGIVRIAAALGVSQERLMASLPHPFPPHPFSPHPGPLPPDIQGGAREKKVDPKTPRPLGEREGVAKREGEGVIVCSNSWQEVLEVEICLVLKRQVKNPGGTSQANIHEYLP